MNTRRMDLPGTDLQQRCRELVEWETTGILDGNGALARLGDEKFPSLGDDRFRFAERATQKEAIRLIAEATPTPEEADLDDLRRATLEEAVKAVLELEYDDAGGPVKWKDIRRAFAAAIRGLQDPEHGPPSPR